MGGSCSQNDDCYFLIGQNNAINCFEGTCKCKVGYIEENGTCNGTYITII